MKRLCILFLSVVSFFPATGWSASLPDWTAPYLTTEALDWKKKSASVILFDESVVTYNTSELALTKKRTMWQLNKPEDYTSRPRIIFSYNQDTFKIKSIKVWMTTPGGKTVSIRDDRLSDTPIYPSGHVWNADRKISLIVPPNIKPGDVLVWEFIYERTLHAINNENWGVGSEPVYHGHFAIIPPTDRQILWYSPAPELQSPITDSKLGSLDWTITKHYTVSKGRPNGFISYPVSVHAKCVTKENPIDTWPSFARLAAEIIEPRVNLSPEIQAKAREISARAPTHWAKVRALVDFIQSEISYLSLAEEKDIFAGYRPQNADQCLTNHYGDCKDKATLLVALLRAIDKQGHVVLLYAGNPLRVRRENALNSFNHAITAIPADADTPPGWPIVDHPTLGRFVIVDSTTSHNPLGTLPRMDQAGLGLLVSPNGGDIFTLPTDTPSYHGITNCMSLIMDQQGNVAIHDEETHQGQAFATLQAKRARQNQKEFTATMEKHLRAISPSIQNLRWQDHPIPLENRSSITVDCEAQNYARRAGQDLLLINPPVLNRPEPLAEWTTVRPGKCWLPLQTYTAEITITLPTGVSLERKEPSLNLAAQGTSATLEIAQTGNTLKIRTQYSQPAGIYEKTAYEAICTLTQKYLQALNKPIVLKTTKP